MAPSPDAQVRAWMALARAAVTKAADPVSLERAALAALTDWFGSREAIPATQLPDHLIDLLVELGLDRKTVELVGEMVLAKPMTGRSRHGAPAPYEGMPAVRRVASEEPSYRAQYVLAASKRLTQADADGRSVVAMASEKRFLLAHVAAGRKRRAAARQADEVAEKAEILEWRTQGDDRVDATCRALEGRLFTIDDPPNGVYPGAAHPRCRCHAAPHGQSPLLRWGRSA